MRLNDCLTPAATAIRRKAASSRELRSNLRASWGDGVAFGGMVGFGETYLAAFVLAAGLGELTAGLVGSVPLIAGGVMQMVSPLLIRRLHSHKRWVVLCALVQAAVFAPLGYAAWQGSISAPAVLILATLYWASGLATGPAWNTWIGTLVPPGVRPRFFALRTRASQAAVFLAFLAGGITLQLAGGGPHLMTAYAALFAIAGGCRLVSAWYLYRHTEPSPMPASMRNISWRELLGQLRSGNGGRLLLYLVAVQAAVQVSGPYFTPFMFRKLELNYGEYVALIGVAYLAKVIALPWWGSMAHKVGAQRLLWIGGAGIAPVAAAWMVSGNLAWLLTVQVLSGVAWAAYELAFFLLFFEAIAPEERTSMLTLYNLINTAAWVAGALGGGAILFLTDASHAGYLIVFAASSFFRALALLLLARLPAIEAEGEEIGLRTLSVRPNAASLDAPVLPSLPSQAE
ncbi:MFS transporter [Lignipirellula cremea]|uniref:Major Facilitator Superfamily protein n=1 Tax=Lignipirellula cremea TaxID=2528010 RepID=A0A518DW11_9BACT|nr:MFS transporter [Lignipirellula cremea]QDU96013.1 Major Facilitator Superfamily protein [Lignipirellula cremea]